MNLHEDFCGVKTHHRGISDRTCAEKTKQTKSPTFSQILTSPDAITLELYAVVFFMQGPLGKFRSFFFSSQETERQ